MNGALSHATGLVAYLGGAASNIVGIQNMLARGPMALVMVTVGDLSEPIGISRRVLLGCN